MSNATDHLALARDYIAKGEDYYRRAADEIIAAMNEDPALSQREVARRLGRNESWVRRLVQARTNAARAAHDEPLVVDWESGSNKRDEVASKVLADPKQRRQVIASLPADVREAVIEESHEAAVADVRAKQAEQRTEPTAGQLMGNDPFDPSESWLDVHIIRVRSKAHALAHQAQKWGVVIGSMSEEEAFEAVTEAERNIAEVRVALQERLRDRDRSEV